MMGVYKIINGDAPSMMKNLFFEITTLSSRNFQISKENEKTVTYGSETVS